MNITIRHYIEGAAEAEGTVVVIDVFRAYTLECYLYARGARAILPVADLDEAFRRKRLHGDWLLFGERHGRMCEGFDCGNSPSQAERIDVAGKTILHTTSAGTKGAAAAVRAREILTGSLVNASAIRDYIRSQSPETVTLVAMGNEGVRPAPEDDLCADYIRSLLEDRPLPDMASRIAALRSNGGSHFFDPGLRDVFPPEDFAMATELDRFPFVIRIRRDEEGFLSTEKIAVVRSDFSPRRSPSEGDVPAL